MTKTTLSREDIANAKFKILCENNYVVIIEIPITNKPPENPINNIYCLDSNGNVVWKVNAGTGNFEDDPFVSIKLMPNGTIKARRFFGKEYIIDKDTGIAEEVGWNK